MEATDDGDEETIIMEGKVVLLRGKGWEAVLSVSGGYAERGWAVVVTSGLERWRSWGQRERVPGTGVQLQRKREDRKRNFTMH